MDIKWLAASLAIAAGAPSYAGGLSAAILPCEKDGQVTTLSVPGDIATAVVRSLLGTTIDAIVAHLNESKVSTFDVIIPVDSIDDLTSGTKGKCLYVSSGKLDDLADKNSETNLWSGAEAIPSPFFTKIKFVSPLSGKADSTSTLRPVILEWKYRAFLASGCPAFRNCTKRDVAISLTFLAPAATVAGRTVSSEPIGFAIVGATAAEVQAAIPVTPGGAALPWFLPGNVHGPVNVRFTLVETSQPNVFTKALGAALAAQKTVLQDSVENKLKGISDQVAAEAAQKDVAVAAKAFDEYKKAYDSALATKVAYDGSTEVGQRNVLSAQYTVQREAARLAEILASAAFSVSGLSWPPGGLGSLPDL
jgi:hypothetical protein